MAEGSNITRLEHFQLLEEHEEDVFKVFSELNISEQLPELFLQLSPFKPNKPGPKAKYIEEIRVKIIIDEKGKKEFKN